MPKSYVPLSPPQPLTPSTHWTLQVLIEQGEQASGLFVVLNGKLNCFINERTAENGLKLVASVRNGDHVGDLSLLQTGSITQAHVHAAEHSHVCLLEVKAFDELCTKHPSLRTALLKWVPKYASINFFVTLPLLAGAPIGAVEELVARVKEESHPAGAVLQVLGSPLKEVYFIKEGTVRLEGVGGGQTNGSPSRRQAFSDEPGTSMLLYASDYFGGGAISDTAAAMEARCETACVVYTLSKANILATAAKFSPLESRLETTPDSIGEVLMLSGQRPEASLSHGAGKSWFGGMGGIRSKRSDAMDDKLLSVLQVY